MKLKHVGWWFKRLKHALVYLYFIDHSILLKLDQGALGMSDPCGTLHLALKPYSVSRINCLLSNFYFCAY